MRWEGRMKNDVWKLLLLLDMREVDALVLLN